MQRLAEVRLAQGHREEAQQLLRRALPLVRWSVVASHLLQRIFGTLIIAAPDAATARAEVDRAEASMGETDRCRFCEVMLAVPAAIACADFGDLDEAHRHLRIAEASAVRWEGSAWQAAACEARAHVARAEGDEQEFAAQLRRAAQLFHAAGHHGDAARCELKHSAGAATSARTTALSSAGSTETTAGV